MTHKRAAIETTREHYQNLSAIMESWALAARSIAEADYYSRWATAFGELVDDLECPFYGLRMSEALS